MYSNKPNQAAKFYQQVSLESRVLSASPHELITLLYEGAHTVIQQAIFFMEQGNIPKRGAAISKAISIINDGLLGPLDHQMGDAAVQQLAEMYRFMVSKLLHANIHRDINALHAVDEMLLEITDAWKQIKPTNM